MCLALVFSPMTQWSHDQGENAPCTQGSKLRDGPEDGHSVLLNHQKLKVKLTIIAVVSLVRPDSSSRGLGDSCDSVFASLPLFSPIDPTLFQLSHKKEFRDEVSDPESGISWR